MMSGELRWFVLVIAVIGGCMVIPAAKQAFTIIDEEVVTISSETPSLMIGQGEQIAVEGIPAGKSIRLKRTQFQDDQGRVVVDFDAENLGPETAMSK